MSQRPHAVRALVLLALLFACGPAARGQERDAPRFEVGAQFTSLAVNLPNPVFGFPVISPGDPGTDPEAGFGARLTYNLSDHFAVEAEGNFFPREQFPGQTFGGFPAQALRREGRPALGAVRRLRQGPPRLPLLK